MMKGKLKQLISVLLISVLVLSMAAPGFAASGHTLTIKSETAGHTFELYQIFKGDVAIDSNGKMNVLTNIDWGDSVTNSTGLIAALQADDDLKDFFADVDTSASDRAQAVAVAAGLSATLDETTASSLADIFAKLVEKYLSETPYDTVTGGDTTYSYQFTNIEDGYYLVKDKDYSLDLEEYGTDTAAYTKYIIGIIGEDKEKDAKADKPDIEKYIENPHTADLDLEKTEEYSIGDDIIYHLESEVPDMDGYDRYWFMVQDELSDGLTFEGMLPESEGYAVTVDGEKVGAGSAGEDWTYTLTQDGQKLYFVFNNFLESYGGKGEYKSYVGKKIVIRYIVRLNESANIGAVGNDNTVSLVYSNNPYESYEGEPSTDGDNPGTGQTSNKKTVTYTTKLKIYKYDSSSEEPISDVSFKLEGTGTQTVYTKKEEADFEYNKADDGDYVLVDGNYVEYNDSYDGYQRYSRTVTSTSTNYFITTQPTGAFNSEVVGVTGTNGELTFTGLGAGTYTLTETDAPKGYNLLTTPITVVITYEDPEIKADEPTGEELATWSYSYTLDDVEYTGTISTKDEEFVISIANTSSALLPSTGGVGTVIFTVVGLCAMAGAVIFLYTKKRREEL